MALLMSRRANCGYIVPGDWEYIVGLSTTDAFIEGSGGVESVPPVCVMKSSPREVLEDSGSLLLEVSGTLNDDDS